ncbi:MAG TPA: hypothetical protein VIO32_09685, partial [Candidatus Baltobacteraceae bacterium]
MQKFARFFICLAGATALTASAALADGAKPIRHLVYNFDLALSTTATVHDSGIGGDGPASGSSDYHSGSGDEGTITVDVLQVQPDTGLVVQIAEQARNRRDAVPTECVTYGNGAVVCDESHGQLNEEEMNLLRFLGRNFVNSALIDAHNHWQYASNDPQSAETNDYTIGKTSGDLLDISYQRVLKVSGVNSFDATTDGSMTYNKVLSMPVSIKEETTTRKNTGAGNYDTVRQDMTFSLAQDSMSA